MTMKRCILCGTDYPSTSQFCRTCGGRLEPIATPLPATPELSPSSRGLAKVVAVVVAVGALFAIGVLAARQLGAQREKEVAEVAQRAHDRAVEEARSRVRWVWSEPAGVYFTRSEVTLGQYRACVSLGDCDALVEPSDTDDLARRMGGPKESCLWRIAEKTRGAGLEKRPINCARWDEARVYCAWAGGRLPTSDEWYAEASNRGTRVFPWGDSLGGCELVSGWECQGLRDVCSATMGNSVSGLCDMAGGLVEWTDTVASHEKQRLVRGRSHGYKAEDQILTETDSRYFGGRYRDVGFRCAKDGEGS